MKIGKLDSPRLEYSTGEVLILSERRFFTLLWIATHFSLQASIDAGSFVCRCA